MRLNLHAQSTLIPAVELESRCAVAYHFHRARRQQRQEAPPHYLEATQKSFQTPAAKSKPRPPLSKAKSKEENEMRDTS